MLERVASHWWILLLRGILALVVGILAIWIPHITALALAILFAAYALVGGIASIVASIRMSHEGSRWGWLLATGIISAIFGVAALIWPAISLLYLVFLMAAWAIITGGFELVAAWRMRSVASEVLWIVVGLLSIAFGVWVLFEPGYGVLAVVYVFAFYAILAGVSLIGLAFRLRARHTRSMTGTT